jgi:hypothetical protein
MANATPDATPEKASLIALAGAAVKEKLGDIKEGWDNLHIGEGHFAAWIRQGFKELTHQLLPAFPQGQHVVEEPGLVGNPTQGEVARGRQDEQPSKQEVAALNEEPMPTQTLPPSPADLVERHGLASRQQPDGQQVSPADLVERNGLGQGQQQTGQDVSPADLLDGAGGASPQQQSQQQRQGHALSL